MLANAPDVREVLSQTTGDRKEVERRSVHTAPYLLGREHVEVQDTEREQEVSASLVHMHISSGIHT